MVTHGDRHIGAHCDNGDIVTSVRWRAVVECGRRNGVRMKPSNGARITVMAPTFPRVPGGGARVFYEHANALARHGHEVTVVHDLGYGTGVRRHVMDAAKARAREVKAGVVRRRVTWMGIDDRIRMMFVPRLDEHTTLPPADLRVGTLWRTTEFLARRSERDAPFTQLLQAYEVWAGPKERVDAVWRLPIHSAVVSNSLRERGIAMGVPADRLHLVPNGLDHSLYRLRQPIAGRPPQVTFLSHPAPVKGLAEAIEVVRLVHAARPDVPIVAFGGHARPASLPDFVQYKHKLFGERLVNEVYDATSVFLCASQSEGWGYPSMEAMACGAALVSTRNGGVDDFAVDGESALLREVGDIEALADAVLALLADEPLRARLAESGVERVRPFTWEACTNAFAKLVDIALKSGVMP